MNPTNQQPTPDAASGGRDKAAVNQQNRDQLVASAIERSDDAGATSVEKRASSDERRETARQRLDQNVAAATERRDNNAGTKKRMAAASNVEVQRQGRDDRMAAQRVLREERTNERVELGRGSAPAGGGSPAGTPETRGRLPFGDSPVAGAVNGQSGHQVPTDIRGKGPGVMDLGIS